LFTIGIARYSYKLETHQVKILHELNFSLFGFNKEDPSNVINIQIKTKDQNYLKSDDYDLTT